MSDLLQHALHSAALHHPRVLAPTAIVLADGLLYVLALGLAVLVWTRRAALTPALVGRVLASGALAVGLALLLGHLVADPRPYLAEHYRALSHVSADNGFPSDHTLAAALLSGWAALLSRRAWWPFALGTALIALGRLAIGAHHTLDVVGSVMIAAAALWLAGRLPWGRVRPVRRAPVNSTL